MVKKKYTEIALGTSLLRAWFILLWKCRLTNLSMIGDEYSNVPGYVSDGNLGFGCGLPTEDTEIKKGDTVVDLENAVGNIDLLNTPKIRTALTLRLVSTARSGACSDGLPKVVNQNHHAFLGKIKNALTGEL